MTKGTFDTSNRLCTTCGIWSIVSLWLRNEPGVEKCPCCFTPVPTPTTSDAADSYVTVLLGVNVYVVAVETYSNKQQGHVITWSSQAYHDRASADERAADEARKRGLEVR
jgi:hypothetical protein